MTWNRGLPDKEKINVIFTRIESIEYLQGRRRMWEREVERGEREAERVGGVEMGWRHVNSPPTSFVPPLRHIEREER